MGKDNILRVLEALKSHRRGGFQKRIYKKRPFLDTALIFLQDVIRDKKINLLMHDGEESDTTLMPFYGYCDYFDESYRNFVNFTVTENPTYDAEIKGIRWVECQVPPSRGL